LKGKPRSLSSARPSSSVWALVEGINRVKRHEKVRPSARGGGQEGGIVTKELPVDLSNVTLICPNCGPTRVGYSVDEEGTKIRICRSCNAELA